MQIPETEHNTVKKIYDAYVRASDSGFRPHLGGSLIGRECNRELWYSFRWSTRANYSGRMLRLFETGQLEEDRFVANLRAAGVEVYDFAPDGKQFRVSACDGHFGGSFDGVGKGFAEDPNTWHLVEMKTHNSKSFALLTKKGVKESKPEHFAQMQVYMHLAEPQLEWAYYLAKNKDNDELYGERIQRDPVFGGHLIMKAADIIYSGNPPVGISTKPDFFKCKLCPHSKVCHGADLPDVNCRTCAHSSPADEGNWICELSEGHAIPLNIQQQGCKKHIYHPDFMKHHAKPVTSGVDWVEYEIEGIEDRFINGLNGYASKEIRGAVQGGGIELLLDSNVEKFKSAFGATIEVLNV